MRYNHDDTQKNLCDNIKAVAAEKRITYKELAEAAGITYRTLKNYFDGIYDMPIATAFFIADRLGLTLTGLIQWRAK